jgi:hypothetical protein
MLASSSFVVHKGVHMCVLVALHLVTMDMGLLKGMSAEIQVGDTHRSFLFIFCHPSPGVHGLLIL